MELHTRRLSLRRVQPEDWPFFRMLWQDYDTSEYARYDVPRPKDDVGLQMLIRRFSEQEFFFAVSLLPDIKNAEGRLIGYVCFTKIQQDYDMGYCFCSEFHGKGFASEACSAAMEYVMTHGIGARFTAGTALKNRPSCRLLERLGFTLAASGPVSLYSNEQGEAQVFVGGVYVKPWTEKCR